MSDTCAFPTMTKSKSLSWKKANCDNSAIYLPEMMIDLFVLQVFKSSNHRVTKVWIVLFLIEGILCAIFNEHRTTLSYKRTGANTLHTSWKKAHEMAALLFVLCVLTQACKLRNACKAIQLHSPAPDPMFPIDVMLLIFRFCWSLYKVFLIICQLRVNRAFWNECSRVHLHHHNDLGNDFLLHCANKKWTWKALQRWACVILDWITPCRCAWW